MSLSLLVYNLGQRELRKALKRGKMGLKNQLGKLTDRPTLRGIFQCFQGIHLLNLNGVEQVVNLTIAKNLCLMIFASTFYLIIVSSGWMR